jgi:hypothetical protein
MNDRPKTYQELFDFYDKYVKLLYGSIQAENILPTEVLFEINAAFDHLSRAWIYSEEEDEVVYKAHSHLKRSCLDIFKLRVKQTLDLYKEICEVDTSIIQNGEYDREMRILISQIKRGAKDARRLEGRPSSDPYEVASFELWQPVFEMCEEFEKTFYVPEKIDWAKKKQRKFTVREAAIGIIGGALAGAFLEEPLKELFKATWELIKPHVGM